MDAGNYIEETSHDQETGFVQVWDLMNEKQPAAQWLVDGVLPLVGFSILAARPKVGKSTLARCLAVAVVKGLPWLNRKVKQGPVMYMAMEEQRSRIAAHFLKFNKMKPGDQLLLWIGPSPENGVEYLAEQIKKTSLRS